MLRNSFIVIGLIAGFSLFAADTGEQPAEQSKFDWHAPAITEHMRKGWDRHLSDKNHDVGKDVKSFAHTGVIVPWGASFFTGALLAGSFGKNDRDILGKGLVGGFIVSAIFFPINAVLSLPAAAVGAAAGLGVGAVHGIRAKIGTPAYKQEVALYLHQWIHWVIKGRQQFREKIKTHQAQCKNPESIKETLKVLFTDGSLKEALIAAKITEEEVLQWLDHIAPEDDNWTNFFPGLSKELKIKSLDDKEWKKLSDTLVKWPNKTGFPSLTEQDIKDHLYFAIYLFTLHDHANFAHLKVFLAE